jgi:hypothetical protein
MLSFALTTSPEYVKYASSSPAMLRPYLAIGNLQNGCASRSAPRWYFIWKFSWSFVPIPVSNNAQASSCVHDRLQLGQRLGMVRFPAPCSVWLLCGRDMIGCTPIFSLWNLNILRNVFTLPKFIENGRNLRKVQTKFI